MHGTHIGICGDCDLDDNSVTKRSHCHSNTRSNTDTATHHHDYKKYEAYLLSFFLFTIILGHVHTSSLTRLPVAVSKAWNCLCYNCTAADILYNSTIDYLISNNVSYHNTGTQLQETDILREYVVERQTDDATRWLCRN